MGLFPESADASIFETTLLVCVTDGPDCSGGASGNGCYTLNNDLNVALKAAAESNEADVPAWMQQCGASEDALSSCLHTCGGDVSDGCFEMYPDYDDFSCSDQNSDGMPGFPVIPDFGKCQTVTLDEDGTIPIISSVTITCSDDAAATIGGIVGGVVGFLGEPLAAISFPPHRAKTDSQRSYAYSVTSTRRGTPRSPCHCLGPVRCLNLTSHVTAPSY